MKLWGKWGWFRRTLFILTAAAFLYSVQQVWLALSQADFDAITFTSETPTRLDLGNGERVNVYLTPRESEALNFDFYPSDLQCAMEGPNGLTISGRHIYEEHRWVDGWNRHWGVESFEALGEGTYELTCRDMSDRRYPLVLASPGPSGRVYPEFALFLLGFAVTMFGISLIVGRSRDRSKSETRSEHGADGRGVEESVDRLGWWAFLFAFLTLIAGPLLNVIAIVFAIPSAYYAWKATEMSRASGVPMNAWGRIAQVASPLLLLWVIAASILELT